MKQPKLKDLKIDKKGTEKMRSLMANKSSPSTRRNIARNADELGELLGLTPSETEVMKYKAKNSSIAFKKHSSKKVSKCVFIVESNKESMSRAFSELKRPSGKYKGMTAISFPDYETLGRVVMGAHLELIDLARQEKSKSIQGLVKLLGRNNQKWD